MVNRMLVDRRIMSLLVVLCLVGLPVFSQMAGADYIGPRVKIDFLTNYVTAGGSASFTVTVFNETGAKVQGATVSVTAAEGQFDAASKPTSGLGTVSFMFTAPSVVTEAHGVVVNATATYGSPPYYSANMTFWVVPAPVTLDVALDGPSSLQKGAMAARYNVTVTANGSSVEGASIYPSMPDRGTITAGSNTTDSQGRAWFTYAPPADWTGEVNISVTAVCSTYTGGYGSIIVTITEGGQPTIAVKISSDRDPLPCWGSCNLTVIVTKGMDALFGASVNWTVSRGCLSSTRSTTDIQGRALVHYTAAGGTSDLWAGTVNMTARADSQGSTGACQTSIEVAPYSVTWQGNLACRSSGAKLGPGEKLTINASVEMPHGRPYEFITPFSVVVELTDSSQAIVKTVVLGQDLSLLYGMNWSSGFWEILTIPQSPTMMKYSWTVYVLSVNSLYTYYSHGPVDVDVIVSGAEDWTFLLYVNGDSNLAGQAMYHLNRMESEAPHGEFNMLAQLDLKGYWQGSRRYEIIRDDNMSTINSVIVQELPELNSGDPAVLYDFLKWGAARAPAGHYLVEIWDHGGGYAGSSWDYSSNSSRFNNSELASALVRFAGEERKVSVLVFDACLMSSMEVAYQLRNAADYIIGAETPITEDIIRPAALENIRNYYPQSRPTPVQICHEILEAWNGTEGPKSPFTAIDTSLVTAMYDAIGALTDAIFEKWSSVGDCVLSAISDYGVRSYGPYQNTQWLVDMRSYLVKLMEIIDNQPMSYRLAKCTEMAQRAIDRLDAMVVDEINTDISNHMGVNLFAPTGEGLYGLEKSYYVQNGLPATSGWVRLLERLFPPDIPDQEAGDMNITGSNFNLIQEDNDADGLVESIGGDLVVAGSQLPGDGLVVMDLLGFGGNRGAGISNLAARQLFSFRKATAASFHFNLTAPLADMFQLVVSMVGTDGRLQNQLMLGMFMMDATPPAGSPPTVSIATGGPTATAGKPLHLSATVSDPDGDNTTIWWDFDDSDAVGLDATGASADTSFRGAGNRTISCIVSDGRNVAVAQATVQVLSDPANHAPVANLTTAAFDAANHLKLTLNASGSSDQDGDTLEYFFNFGDGDWTGWTKDKHVDHVYASNGSYECVLRVRDPASLYGVSLLESVEVKWIQPNHPPVPVLVLVPSIVKIGEAVRAQLTCTDPDSGDTVEFWIDWGDGAVSNWTGANNLTHSYATAGAYNITLTARDGGNLTGQAASTVKVGKKAASTPAKGFIPGAGPLAVLAAILCGLAWRPLRRRPQTVKCVRAA